MKTLPRRKVFLFCISHPFLRAVILTRHVLSMGEKKITLGSLTYSRKDLARVMVAIFCGREKGGERKGKKGERVMRMVTVIFFPLSISLFFFFLSYHARRWGDGCQKHKNNSRYHRFVCLLLLHPFGEGGSGYLEYCFPRQKFAFTC